MKALRVSEQRLEGFLSFCPPAHSGGLRYVKASERAMSYQKTRFWQSFSPKLGFVSHAALEAGWLGGGAA
ncbi:hypothetical protein C0V82_20635 [Niveispirillum cyanobacteriorum]|uniref:Uncharacterized protein n=1 Tax=Niveispirillum cyanobacteriorum TaxID=1612173 RepID=A0A2K9NI39_9PROT|nr:hypothetical protein C0V82_20635 [Niveispirillum cyanobacteriorum]